MPQCTPTQHNNKNIRRRKKEVAEDREELAPAP
jgi:hypothetical protein